MLVPLAEPVRLEGITSEPTGVPEHPTFRPGPFAAESIPARSAAQTFTAAERAEINRIGRDTGCHTCGAKDPGTKPLPGDTVGNHIPDHQPVSKLSKPDTSQRLYPHCKTCSNKQGLAAANAVRAKAAKLKAAKLKANMEETQPVKDSMDARSF